MSSSRSSRALTPSRTMRLSSARNTEIVTAHLLSRYVKYRTNSLRRAWYGRPNRGGVNPPCVSGPALSTSRSARTNDQSVGGRRGWKGSSRSDPAGSVSCPSERFTKRPEVSAGFIGSRAQMAQDQDHLPPTGEAPLPALSAVLPPSGQKSGRTGYNYPPIHASRYLVSL